jgi:hypothetical protein
MSDLRRFFKVLPSSVIGQREAIVRTLVDFRLCSDALACAFAMRAGRLARRPSPLSARLAILQRLRLPSFWRFRSLISGGLLLLQPRRTIYTSVGCLHRPCLVVAFSAFLLIIAPRFCGCILYRAIGWSVATSSARNAGVRPCGVRPNPINVVKCQLRPR